MTIFNRGGVRHFHLGGPLEGPVLQQGELSMVCIGLSERDLKILGRPLGGQANFWGGSAPPWHPLAPPLIFNEMYCPSVVITNTVLMSPSL